MLSFRCFHWASAAAMPLPLSAIDVFVHATPQRATPERAISARCRCARVVYTMLRI